MAKLGSRDKTSNGFDVNDVIRMRGLLLGITVYLKEFMMGDAPKPPPRRASVDAQSDYMEWYQCRMEAISEAEELLQETEDTAFDILGVTNANRTPVPTSDRHDA